MSSKIKTEDTDEDCFTVLDEVQGDGDEIDLTFDDDTPDVPTETQNNNANDLTTTVDEDVGYLNSEGENNIFGEIENVLKEHGEVFEQDEIADVQNGNQAAEDAVENWQPISESIDLDQEENDHGVEEMVAPVQVDKDALDQNIIKVEDSAEAADSSAEPVASNPENEVIEVLEHDEGDDDHDDEAQPPENVTTHPYLYLIETFEYHTDQMNLTSVEEVKPVDRTPLFIIFNEKQFLKMLQKLRTATEIAVDYQLYKQTAVISLIAISTKDEDYIIDAFALKHDLLLLTEIFINPKIVKILHHARKTLATFQQKLRLYMVNIFAIERARNILEDTGMMLSINSLLKNEYDVDRGLLPQADWRQRPLPESYKFYVRTATHYMVHLYLLYKNKLLLKDPTEYKKFLDYCRDECKLMHDSEKPESIETLEQAMKNRHECELEVLRKLFNWRATVAQRLKLKTEQVLHSTNLMVIARTLSNDESEIYRYGNSSYIKFDIQEIMDLIQNTKVKYKISTRPKTKKFKPKVFQKVQKRKLNNQLEYQSKQMRIETESPRGKNVFQKRQSEDNSSNTREDFSFNKKKNLKYGSPSNKNINMSTPKDKKTFTKPFFNKSSTRSGGPASNTRNKNRNHQPFEKRETRFSDIFANNSALSDPSTSNLVLLTPTNFPSQFTFQPNPLLNKDSPNPNNFNNLGASGSNFIPFNERNNRQRFDRNSSRGNFSPSPQNTRQFESGSDMYKTLVELKQARDNIRTQAAKYSGNFNAGRLQDLNMIDQKISMLEIKLQQFRSGNNNTRNESSYNNRRYFRD